MEIEKEEIKNLEVEIEEMEKIAEKFRNNKYSKKINGKHKAYGIDAIMNLTNFVLEYDRRNAVLNYLEDKNISKLEDDEVGK